VGKSKGHYIMISKGIIQREIKAVWIVLHTGTPVSQHRSCLFYLIVMNLYQQKIIIKLTGLKSG
jgi:hypothetical protein